MPTAQPLCPPSSPALHRAGMPRSTPSWPRNSAGLARSALLTPTTARSAISSALPRSRRIKCLAQDVFSFAHGVGLSGREPSPTTVSARICCLSSFYKFLIRLDLLTSNPCDPVDRPKIQPSAPRGLTASQVQLLLGVIPDTVKGRRDRAIIVTLILTARRRSEVINLTAGDISFDDSAVFYRYLGKGGVRGRRELPSSRPGRHTAVA